MLAFLDRSNIGISIETQCASYLSSLGSDWNVGNAAIQGMIEELGMTEGNLYNVALFIFFVPYILFEVPSNIFIKRIAPSTWLSLIMFLWGTSLLPKLNRTVNEVISMPLFAAQTPERLTSSHLGIVTIGQGCVNTPGQLQAMRFLLGLFESGFFPGW